jgi:thiamine biosynthesis lipoprotein
MGTDVHLVAVGAGGDEALEGARHRIDDLEQRWSRFLPHTELAEINATAETGDALEVSAVTFDIVDLALRWWLGPGPARGPTGAAPGCAGIVLDRERMSVRLAPRLALDLGGIGKGASADIVGDELEDRPGVVGGCVNLGGDLRVWGTPPEGHDGWSIGVDDPFSPDTSDAGHVIGLLHGAVATSTTTKRTWRTPDGAVAHHLIDPRTGHPAETDLVQVTVIADDVVTAEILAKSALLAGSREGAALLGRHGVSACLTRSDGSAQDVGDYRSYRW